jgi:hypothetical protein
MSASADLAGKLFDVDQGIENVLLEFWGGGQVGVAQPVVAHHAVFIGIGDGPGF